MAIFVDTNVLVYARDTSEKVKQPQALAWMSHLWESKQGRLSQQVLHEFYVTVTRKLSPGLGEADARGEVRDLLAWRPLPLDAAMLERAWSAQDRFELAFWDALIVASAHAAGCEYLLTEDLQDGQDLDGLKVMNPFTHTP